MGFQPKKNIEFAIKEIVEAIENKTITNFMEDKYSNYKTLFGSKDMQEKVFIQGID